MNNIKEFVDIKEFSTFHIGGVAKYFKEVFSVNDIKEGIDFAKKNSKKIFILGGGSNVIFSDGVLDMLILKISMKSFEVINDTKEFTDIKVGAGEIFDNFIQKTIEMNLSGLEALSSIPGTVGATPVQNVGAYGVEVKDLIQSVEILNIENYEIINLSNKECRFDYRNSIFKNDFKDKYIIISVTYRLSKNLPQIPNYSDVIGYFDDKNIEEPDLIDIRKAIIFIRSTKLPDWNILPNVGSFFKNPIISRVDFDKIKINFPDIKSFKIDENNVKIPAGWLIDKIGFKGKSFGNISIYENNALVLVNNGGAKIEDLIFAKNEIIKIIKNRFNIILEQEPEIID